MEQKKYHFRPKSGLRLPKVSTQAQRWMRLHAALGIRFTEKKVRTLIGLPKDVQFQAGFRCMAGRLHFKGHASLSDTLFVDYAPIMIGENVAFSFRNAVLTSTHNRKDFSEVIACPVIIEDDVWITTNVTILGGVTIGRGSIIGAGSVVTKDIPPNSFAAGSPCKVIRALDEPGGGSLRGIPQL
jgi:maltose O-acetyltransferase